MTANLLYLLNFAGVMLLFSGYIFHCSATGSFITNLFRLNE